jgi:tetratricopeptide (TPR) repeat protein
VVEWSWELLDAPEQVLARRLSIFAGGATIGAAERVTGATVDVLAGLVDKSLVEVVERAGEVGGGRYRMLDTVRAFATERLAEAGETDRLRRAHCSYFLDLAWTADPYLRRAEQRGWLSRLDAERDNFHAALRGALAAGELDTALELVAALSSYWWLRGVRSEAAVLAGEVVAALGGGRLGPEPPPGREEEYALCVLNAALGGSGDPALAARLGSYASLLSRLERPPRQPVLFLLSALTTGPPDGGVDAAGIAERGQELLDHDPWTRALGPLGLGYVWLWSDQLARAEPLFVEALDGFRAIGERWGMTNALAALAEVADLRGDRARSVAMIDEALRLAGELDSAADTADLLRLRGDGGIRAGELAAAGADYQGSAVAARRAGAPDILAAASHGLAEVARLRGDVAEARRIAGAALAACPSGWFTADSTRSDLSVTLGRIAEAEGDVGTARERYRQALDTAGGAAGLPAATAAREALARLGTRPPDLGR